MYRCNKKNILPKFTFISKKELRHVNWSKSTIREKRFEILHSTIREQEEKNEKNTAKINTIFNSLPHLSKRFQKKLLLYIENGIKKVKHQSDTKREAKLKKLTKENSTEKNQKLLKFSI